MSDPHEPARDDARADESDLEQPAFDDPGHAWVRDLLADARVTTAPPADVSSRLDDTLAALQAEQQAPANVVPLRRRLRPRLAVAAAAVIVAAAGGVVVTQLQGGPTGSNSTSSGAADSTARKAAPPSGPSGAGPQALSGTAVPSLSRTSFATDAAALMRTIAADRNQVGQDSAQALPSPTSVPGGTPGAAGSTSEGLASAQDLRAPALTATPPSFETDRRSPGQDECRGPAVTGAVTLPALLDATPVALVFRAPTAAGQRVEAWSCDGSSMLAQATIGP
ncbi:MAG TPA: hypothetical protein VHO29_17675 [Marmoricola sp.]|nr:hypothetical protein [Marmoricola sp.]